MTIHRRRRRALFIKGQQFKRVHPGPGETYQLLVKKKGGTKQDVGSPTATDADSTVSAVYPELSVGDAVGVVRVDSRQPVPGTARTIAVASPIDITKGGPIGLLLGGAVRIIGFDVSRASPPK